MKIQSFGLSARTRAWLGNLVLCAGLSTAVATTNEADGRHGTPPPWQTASGEQTFPLPQHGVMHVTVELGERLLENAEQLSIDFTLVSPSDLNAELTITPDFTGQAFHAKVADGRSVVVERGDGAASAWLDGNGADVRYVILFAPRAIDCAPDALAKGICMPRYSLVDVCDDASPCSLGFTLERNDFAPMAPAVTNVHVKAGAAGYGIMGAQDVSQSQLRVSIDD